MASLIGTLNFDENDAIPMADAPKPKKPKKPEKLEGIACTWTHGRSEPVHFVETPRKSKKDKQKCDGNSGEKPLKATCTAPQTASSSKRLHAGLLEPIGDKPNFCEICNSACGEVSAMPPAKYKKSNLKQILYMTVSA